MGSHHYKLAASLSGHGDDVRDVVFPHPNLVLSASRDATVRSWTLLSTHPSPNYDCALVSHGTTFVNSLAFVPPSSRYPDGLVLAGGKDAIIEARRPGRPPEHDAEALLLGHGANVCALDVSSDGTSIVSGSWDAEARVWLVGEWEAAAVLKGHEGSVWAVLAFDGENIITGCADRQIRVFNPSGKLLRTVKGSSDVVRALCRLPAQHSSGAHFASAGNDATIRLWTLDGKQVSQLHGHESFIYSLACLPSGEIVSSSEDRTVRIWKDGQCIQTITHPAISVWAVAVCQQSGDIVTGASDRIVRVFSRAPDRQASAQDLAAFEDSVKGSSIPQQQMGDINKEKLPGPEFLLQKSGTKDGQVQMIRENDGSITAHQWSTAANQWVSVGTVVDAVGSSGKKQEYRGQDYDYVFDVDIEDGKPPLKLPYNLSQNPYEIAQKFVANNELPVTYLDQVANFIITNTQGATIGPQQSGTQPPGSDPWGSEARYRPGEVGSAPSQQPPEARPKVLPQTQYLTIKTANLKAIHKKVEELNQQLISTGRKDISLNPSDLKVLEVLVKQLEDALSQPASASAPALMSGVDLVLRIITLWPAANKLPLLDILRLLTATSGTVASHVSDESQDIVDILSHVFADTDRPNNIMMAIRAFANMFETEEGRFVADGEFERIHDLVSRFLATPSDNRNITIAIMTLYINYAVLLTSPSTNQDRGSTLLKDLAGVIGQEKDSEALYRALVAAGTLLSMGGEVRTAAREIFEIEGAAKRAQGRVKEPRIKGVVAEIIDALH